MDEGSAVYTQKIRQLAALHDPEYTKDTNSRSKTRNASRVEACSSRYTTTTPSVVTDNNNNNDDAANTSKATSRFPGLRGMPGHWRR
jgi:hypothetical protein